MQNYVTREDWLQVYSITQPDGTVVTYGEDRSFSGDDIPGLPKDNAIEQKEVWIRADALRSFMFANGGDLSDRIIILGAGMGFLNECLLLMDFENCWGVDNSPFLEERRSSVAPDAQILNIDLQSPLSEIQAALIASTGDSTFKWIITESLMESLTDAEIVDACTVFESLLSPEVPTTNMVHIVYTPPFNDGSSFNEKEMNEWKSIRPSNTWMNAEGYQVY